MLLQQFDVVCDLAEQAFIEIERAGKLLEHPNLNNAKIQDCLRAAALILLSLKLGAPKFPPRMMRASFSLRKRGLAQRFPNVLYDEGGRGQGASSFAGHAAPSLLRVSLPVAGAGPVKDAGVRPVIREPSGSTSRRTRSRSLDPP
jgi:hypothetical protein